MRRHKSILVPRPLLAALLLSCGATAHAASEPLPSIEVAAVAGITIPKYFGPRLGDIAPQFTLPDANGKLWSSRDQLGKQAILLILIGEAPVLSGKNLTPPMIMTSIAEAAAKLHAQGVETRVVSQAKGLELGGLNPQFDALNLRDEKGELQQFFNPNPTTLTVVAIDRAGFLRCIETVREPQSIGDLMRRLGDSTPKFEVGKPAPDFAISDMNGRVRRLSDLRGQKNLLLSFFPKCFTGG